MKGRAIILSYIIIINFNVVYAQKFRINTDTVCFFWKNGLFILGEESIEPKLDSVLYDAKTKKFILFGYIDEYDYIDSGVFFIDKISNNKRIKNYVSIGKKSSFNVHMLKNDTLFFRSFDYKEGYYYKYATIRKPLKKVKIDSKNIISVDTIWDYPR